MRDVTRTITLQEFIDLVKDVAREQEGAPMLSGLESQGAEYCILKEKNIDSVGTTEALIAIEEALERRFGRRVTIPDAEIDGNCAQLYKVVCKVIGILPSM